MISGTSFLGKGRGALHEKGLTLIQENMFPVNIHSGGQGQRDHPGWEVGEQLCWQPSGTQKWPG